MEPPERGGLVPSPQNPRSCSGPAGLPQGWKLLGSARLCQKHELRRGASGETLPPDGDPQHPSICGGSGRVGASTRPTPRHTPGGRGSHRTVDSGGHGGAWSLPTTLPQTETLGSSACRLFRTEGRETHTHSFYVPGLTTGGWTTQKPKTHTVVGDEGEGSPELEGSPPAGPGAARGPLRQQGCSPWACSPYPFSLPSLRLRRTLGLVTAY